MPPLGTPSARRPGLGSPRPQQHGGGARPAAQAPSSQRGGNGNERIRSVWQTIVNLYDPWHSAMALQVVAEFFEGAKFAIKLSPVFAERRGPDDDGTGRKFNYDDGATVVFSLPEAIVFRAQLDAFLAGAVTEIIIPRLDTKRLVLTSAEAFYDASHPEYADHANGLVLSIEEDATDKADAKSVIFISRQKVVDLGGGDPVAFFPELQSLLTALDSYLSGVARVDFASCRLLGQSNNNEAKDPGPTAPQPVRRTAAAPTAGGRTQPAESTESAPAPTTVASSGGIDDALGSVSDEELAKALGDTPQF